MYEFWKTDEGYVLCVQIFQGVAGDRIVKIRVPDNEALELRANSDLLRLKVEAVGRNPGLFAYDLVDFTSPESAPAKPR
ncbi:hypothetical protein BH10BDE1_BH10BDE1_28620 [soil metagenome]